MMRGQAPQIFFPRTPTVYSNQQSNPSDLSDKIDPVWWKRTHLSDLMHTITSLYPIIPQSLRLAIWNSLLASWAWLIKIYSWSQIFLRCIQADLDLTANEFKQIGFILLIDCWLWMQPLLIRQIQDTFCTTCIHVSHAVVQIAQVMAGSA